MSSEKMGMGGATELLRKGGTLLREPCPNCGSVQLRYENQNICMSCEGSSDVEKNESLSFSNMVLNTRNLALKKIGEILKQLSGEVDIKKQTQNVELLLKYLEVIHKIDESSIRK